MKILYIHQYFTTPKGMGGTRSYEFAKKLVEKGHQVTMVCSSSQRGWAGLSTPFHRGKRKGIVEGIEVIEFNIPYSNYMSFLKRAITFLRFSLQSIKIALTHDYDLLFATSTPLTAGIPGIFTRIFRPKKRFVFEVRDLWPELPKAMGVIKNKVILKLMDWLETAAYRSAHACIGLSPGIQKGIQKKVPKKPIAMIPNGCDLSLFDAKASPMDLEQYGIKSKDFVAVFSGAHGFANGLDAILKMAKVLKEKNQTSIKILFVGEGVMKPKLQAKAKKWKLDNCIFIDSVPKLEMPNLLAAVDAGLMVLANIPAFYYGTSPNKFFDYIAAGLPVINNYPGWLEQLITENQCGTAVPPEDPNTFAKALIDLSQNPNLCTLYSKNALMLAKKEFNRDNLSQKFVAFLEEQI